ncbi:MAG: hypothetical protein IH845_03810 [Nanoarchaeota archaeon]|nr:hypothetical protein [Nanoarchaeota archaeon]
MRVIASVLVLVLSLFLSSGVIAEVSSATDANFVIKALTNEEVVVVENYGESNAVLNAIGIAISTILVFLVTRKILGIISSRKKPGTSKRVKSHSRKKKVSRRKK